MFQVRYILVGDKIKYDGLAGLTARIGELELQYDYAAYPAPKRESKVLVAMCIWKSANLSTEWYL